MKITVWIVSGLLAVAFLFIGLTKVLTPAAELQVMSEGVPVVLLKIAGTAEVLGALGLLLPALTRVLPVLTPLAATGLVVTMIGAAITKSHHRAVCHDSDDSHTGHTRWVRGVGALRALRHPRAQHRQHGESSALFGAFVEANRGGHNLDVSARRREGMVC